MTVLKSKPPEVEGSVPNSDIIQRFLSPRQRDRNPAQGDVPSVAVWTVRIILPAERRLLRG